MVNSKQVFETSFLAFSLPVCLLTMITNTWAIVNIKQKNDQMVIITTPYCSNIYRHNITTATGDPGNDSAWLPEQHGLCSIGHLPAVSKVPDSNLQVQFFNVTMYINPVTCVFFFLASKYQNF